MLKSTIQHVHREVAPQARIPGGYAGRLELEGGDAVRPFGDDELVAESTWSTARAAGGVPGQITFGSPEPFGFPSTAVELTGGGSDLIPTDPFRDGFERT